MDELIGKMLSHYRVIETIGAGGMGVVYRAHDDVLDRDVAIKVLPAEVSADPDRLRRFEREARAAGALNHPNILAVHDFGEHDGVPYVVTELLEGRTLREEMGGRALAVRKALDYGAQIARGLAAAHEKGIVHRDLKPENVFVTSDGRVKILDFGIAKWARPGPDGHGASTQTAAGTIVGTAGYMSPEQIRGQDVDHRSDLFALGVLLQEMLTGKPTFRGETRADTMSAILTQDPPPVSALRDGVPDDLDRAVRRCLEKNVRERAQSAWDLASELDRLIGAGTGAGTRTGAGTVSPRPSLAPLRRFVPIVGVAGLLVVAVLLLLRIRDWGRPAPGGAGAIHSVAVLPLQNLSADPEQAYFVDGMTEELTAAMAQIGTLKIISRTSAMKYRNTKKALPEIGRELGVDALVEGSVLRAGSRVRVTAQLIRAATDEHLWAQSYERDLRDVLALQSGVAHLVASEIARVLHPGETPKPTPGRSVDPEAHEDYLMGRFFWNSRTPDGLTKAFDYYQRSIRRDSTYARPYAAVAEYYNVLPFYTPVAPKDAFPKAKAAAERAIAIDETVGEAHAALALEMAYYEWNWTGAEREFRRALALTPNNAGVHHSYSRFLVSTNRGAEGLAELKRAQELDPLSIVLKANEGMTLFFEGRYDEAATTMRHVMEIDSTNSVAPWGYGLILEQQGRNDEAAKSIQKAMEMDGEPDPNAMGSLGHIWAGAGKREEARRLLKELAVEAKKYYVSPYHAALIHAGLGEKDTAFDLLQEAATERSTLLVYIKKDPRLANLHADPRFQALIERIGLPG